jgi:hypothetical protein
MRKLGWFFQSCSHVLVPGLNRTIFYPSVRVAPSGTAQESDRRERIANDPECWVKTVFTALAAIYWPGAGVARGMA